MDSAWVVVGFVALVIGSYVVDHYRNRRHLTELDRLATGLAAVTLGTNGLQCTRHGVAVTAHYTTRGNGSTVSKWTEVEAPLPSNHPLSISLRPHVFGDRGRIARGAAIDVELGDAAFDRAFLLEAAPTDVVATLFDEPTRNVLLRVPRVRVETLEGRLRISVPDWIDITALGELIGVTGRMASRVRGAFASPAAAMTGEPYRGRPDATRERELAIQREHEIAGLEDLVPVRLEEERTRDRWASALAVAFIGTWVALWALT